MEDQQSKCQVLHEQARGIVVEVLGHLKWAADSSHPVHDVAKCQECTADACGVALRTVSPLLSEENLCLIHKVVYIFNCQIKIGKKYKK
jgi:hypothetical protein